MISYNIVGDEHGQSLTMIFSDGSTKNVPESHPNYVEIVGLLLDKVDDENRVSALADVTATVAKTLTRLSERVSVAGHDLLFDGDPIDGALADHIVRLVRDNDEGGYKPLVAFLENLAQNPSEESRNALYRWLSAREFTITDDGHFLAYKGVNTNNEGIAVSVNTSGSAYVNGEFHKGAIPNPIGAEVTMPRSEVDPTSSHYCSTGLHAGTWDYVKWFAGNRVLTVKINPRDVVSVPNDHSSQKLRTCRYIVVEETDKPNPSPTYYAATGEDYYEEDFDEEDYDDEDEDDDEDRPCTCHFCRTV